jgi:cyclopropane fatty-acyl-phospholipid synthase-like methyltransferase
VPTPDDIAEKMCELAKITKDDIVYDCGCGDGILIITAVKKAGAKKAVGVDIDPKRVEDAKAAVAKAGLSDKIEIKEGNALEQSKKTIGEATVIMTYMGNELNSRFRPILWNSLSPGARIVSHRFVMGDWKPDKSIKVKGADGDEYELHVWTITGKEKDGDYPKSDKEPE